MINLIDKTVENQGKVEKIIKYEVWWVTPWGLIDNLDIAISRCIANDVNVNEVVRSVPVAVTETSYEVLM